VSEVILVGDRGMIKAKGKDALDAEGWRYITALTDAQVRTLLKHGVLQTDMFDHHLCEAEYGDKRLVVRRNESVQTREARRRDDKLKQLTQKIAERNAYVAGAKRADAQKGVVSLERWVKSHKLGAFVTLRLEERMIACTVGDDGMSRIQVASLDTS
jgi:ribosomal protein L11 methylase PrmA